MTNIIKVDFSNKCKAGEYEHKRFRCHVCGEKYVYDSRKDNPEDRVAHLPLPLATGGVINICQYCAEDIKQAFGEGNT